MFFLLQSHYRHHFGKGSSAGGTQLHVVMRAEPEEDETVAGAQVAVARLVLSMA